MREAVKRKKCTYCLQGLVAILLASMRQLRVTIQLATFPIYLRCTMPFRQECHGRKAPSWK